MSMVNNLDEILKKEISLFQIIYEIEKEKKKALLKRDAECIDKLSYKQEEYISQINQWEEKRNEIQTTYAAENFNDAPDAQVTLKDIAKHENSKASSQLLKKGNELKDIVLNLSKLQELNKKLIKDNLDMIGAVLNEIKQQGTVHMGYDKSGKEKGKLPGSVLFNKTV